MIKYSDLTTLILSFFLFTSLNAQSTLSGKTVVLKNENKELTKMISEYTIYEFDIEKKNVKISSASPILKLELGESRYDLNLYQDNLAIRYEKTNASPLLLGGSLRNGGSVSLTVNDNFIYGFIKDGPVELYIEPLSYLVKGAPKNQFIAYYAHHVIEDKEHVCGVTETVSKTEKYLPRRTISACKVIELAIANTYDMIVDYGTNTAVENHNLAVLNNVQTNYRSEFDVNIEFDVVEHFFPSSTAQDPLDPPTSTTNANTLLINFRNWARGPGNAGGGNSGGATGGFGVDYTMATLWTERDISYNGSSGVVGLAYTPGWHHLLEDYTASAPSLNAMVSHEKGHNFSANHDASGSNFIMAPSVTITGDWSATSKTSINNRVNAQAYLSDCSTLGSPTANFFQSAFAVCSGSTIEFEDQTQYGETRDWEFFGGSPTTSVEEKQVVTYNTAGLYAVKLEGHNGVGSDTYYGYVDIGTAPPTPCSPSGGTGGSGGITLVALNGMNNASTTSGVYEDFACDKVATLDPGTGYTLTVGVQSVGFLRYFVDYNNDGDFLDTNESSGTYTFSGNGNLNVGLTTTASPVLESLLRFRVTVSSANNIGADGCTAPGTGQAEDYSFYFEAPQVLGCMDPTASNYDSSATVDDGTCTYGSTTWYFDGDMDTFGDPNNTTTAGNQPTGYVADNTDCDDNDANNYPGNTEVCDGQDNDCDGLVDEGVQNTYYADSDGDGYGDNTSTTQACSAPSGYVTNNTDCDDNDSNNFPGNTEVCDGQDNNCNGTVDEGVQNTYYADSDGDGYGNNGSTTLACSAPSGYVTNNTDCDDNDSNNYPGNTEVCDGQDNNCNGTVDEGVQNTYYADSDGDGYGDSGSTTQACSAPAGYVSNSTDCDDNDSNNYPGNTEVCDGQDNDCDGLIDENGLNTYYADNDGDGYGDSGSTTDACSQPSGYVSNSSDCDDNDANNYPGNTEVCDGQDNDCDGAVDEGAQNTYYADNDGDGYGDSGSTTSACSLPSGYVTNSSDCDDNDSNNYPGNTEVCDGQDNDCDGTVDEGCSSGSTCDGAYLIINTITQNTYQAQIHLESSATVSGANAVLFTAGTDIDFLPGFEVILGSDFEARIEPCTPFAPGDVDASSGIDNLGLAVQETFEADEEINVTIINIDNIIEAGGLMKTRDLKRFVSNSARNLKQGTYKVIFNNLIEEYTQDLLIIN